MDDADRVFETVSVVEIFDWKRYRVKKKGREHVLTMSFGRIAAAAAAAKSLQSCPTLCDPIDGSPPGSTVPVILQARTLKWVAIPFSNA